MTVKFPCGNFTLLIASLLVECIRLYEILGGKEGKSITTAIYEAAILAGLIYQEEIEAKGYRPPETFGDLLVIVLASGAQVVQWSDAPATFAGVYMDGVIHLGAHPSRTERQKTRTLAHEWAHNRRMRHAGVSHQIAHLHHYSGTTSDDIRGFEEMVAKAFEKLF